MNTYIGIDLGTSSVKLLLVDGDGEIRNEAVREYPVNYPHSGWSEQSPADWWSAICSAIPELLQGFDGGDVKAIAVAGQMHGLVALDKNGDVIRPAILWNDGRTGKETEYLNGTVGKETLFEYTGNIAFAGFTAPKLLWMREHEPERFAAIDKIMLPKDYVNYRLTGNHVTDHSDASGMLLLDVKNKCWSREMLDLCGINEKQMPRLYDSFESVGCVTSEIAELFGISEKTVVAAGAGDNAAAAVGTGTVGAGGCNISLGTSGTVFISNDSFSGDAAQAIHSFCHADGGYHLMSCILSAASCNSWFCKEILHTEAYAAEESQIKRESLGKNEVIFLPYLMGERSPVNDTNATGVFIGLRPDTSREDMHQAVLEGVAFAIKDNIEIIKEMGVDISCSTLCGGGAKSRLWREILADVLGFDLYVFESEQGPGFGAALLAMVASGRFDTVKAAVEHFERPRERIVPDGALVELYSEKFKKYRKIYPALKELYREIRS